MTSLLILTLASACVADAPNTSDRYFKITVVDEQTGRGVPLVELETVNNIRYYTDSNGIVAFSEPGLMDKDVFFNVKSHGYKFPPDGFGISGRALRTTPGGTAELKINRINIAERLYRITGGGIYRDSILTGHPVPINDPLINGLVLGQDSIQSAFYKGKQYWFWGDTSWPKYPLGNFHMAGATSLLPSQGGLDPNVGVNLNYFVRENGFAKEMAPYPEPGPVWLDAFVTLEDKDGNEQMLAAYGRVTPAMKAVERGLMRYNDDKQIFEKVVEIDLDEPVQPNGHPFIHPDGAIDYVLFAKPFPLVRVPATVESYLDIDQYEAWTPLKEGSTLEAPKIDRTAEGRIRYAWRKHTPPLDQKQQNELIEKGLIKPEEAWIHLQDVDTGKQIIAHAGSVYWNHYRRRWITIRCEQFGTSMLGETWYAEADTPLGPWVYARKVVTHDKYDFYNPKHHPFFDQDGGRVIYFEGTYVNTFSGNPEKTPRYDYNQIMYKLDLTDQRLVLPVPVYRTEASNGASLATRHHLEGQQPDVKAVAFFALDHPAPDSIAVSWQSDANGPARLTPSAISEAPSRDEVAFYTFARDHKDPPSTTIPLYEFIETDGLGHHYTTAMDWSKPGYRRVNEPVCLVWKNPMRFD